MIYSGFPCIGKSTLAEKHHLPIIDLESSMLFVDGKRPDNWEKIYINYAEDLNRQGFDVFVSSHKSVRDEMKQRDVDFISIFPSKELKPEWERKLKERYYSNPTEKNQRAMNYILEHFEESIDDMSKDPRIFCIENADYSLASIL